MNVSELAIVLSNIDNVAIAKSEIKKDTIVSYKDTSFLIEQELFVGARFAIMDIQDGAYLKQFGFSFAKSTGIKAGQIVGRHNTIDEIPIGNRDNFTEPKKTKIQSLYANKTFDGFIRADGNVGTRNYIAIIPTSMCSSAVANQIADFFNKDMYYQKYQNISGVVSLAHTEGCGCGAGMQIERTMRILVNCALHSNVGAVLFVDLGCEQTNYEAMSKFGESFFGNIDKPLKWLTIQENGGIEKTIQDGIEIIKKFMPEINMNTRKSVSISNLTIGTECGASDVFSGISANPLIGSIVDKVVYAGGSAILSEVPEMLGVFDMLFDRFASLEVASKFESAVNWYLGTAKKLGINVSDNVVSKNIAGGLFNSYIKSLGAVAKGGTTRIEDVVEYGDMLCKKGLSIMQGPGNDLEWVTGLSSSGANIICFSTGYGTVTASALVPVIKISSNSKTFEKLAKDMDFDAGRVIMGESFDDLSEELLDMVIAVASGRQTWSERWGQKQFQIWTAGKLSL